ncbi:antizyme inhibitor 1b [Denticeps clupeoides]|uniref:Orn/DAP/Arg decarboxylase 2 N-terminal domain-containing protein n=1 Tax=Denticeps clupeoides TaxID=299321 RepID=A0AAY4CVK5_9TELE|nr:antizyme inhibitor 1-like [Denticeps clupeoides]
MKGFSDEPTCVVELLEGGATVEDVIDNHIYEQALAEKSAFAVADLGALMRQHVLWQSTAPQVRPFYPVKFNSSPVVIELLAALGVGFVCANKAELGLVLSYDVAPENIILSGGCKQLSHIKYAAKNAIDYLVCDNEVELCKIARAHPKAKLLLQVSTEARAEETNMVPGCSLKSCRHLLETAGELGVQVVGATFQVPSSCKDPQAYSHALADARCVFDMGEELGFNMNILDIGGGFSGSVFQLDQIHAAIRPRLDAYFPPTSGVHVIAEPGAFYVSPTFTLAVSIIGKKAVARDRRGQPQDLLTPNDEPEFLYYMNDGAYGSFVDQLLGGTVLAPSVHKASVSAEESVFSSSLWGPTGDVLDQVVEHCLLPELDVGDWLVFRNVGLSGQKDPAGRPPVYYTISTGDWYDMQEAGISLDSTLKKFSLVQHGA